MCGPGSKRDPDLFFNIESFYLVLKVIHYPLAEVEGREIRVAVRQQRVAHHKELVKLRVSPGDEVRLPGILSLELREVRVH